MDEAGYLIWRIFREADLLQSGTMHNSIQDLMIPQQLHVSSRPSNAPQILEVTWCPPPPG